MLCILIEILSRDTAKKKKKKKKKRQKKKKKKRKKKKKKKTKKKKKKKDKKALGLQISHVSGSFSNDIMAVRGLTTSHVSKPQGRPRRRPTRNGKE